MSIQLNISLRDILLYSPYESERPLSVPLDAFDSHMFCETKEFLKADEQLLEYCDNTSDVSKNWVILHGFGGNGKTTFVNWFAKRHKSTIKTIYLDCSKSTVPAEIHDSKDAKDYLPIKSAILTYLTPDRLNVTDVERFLNEKKKNLEPQFTQTFYSKLSDANIKSMDDFQAFLRKLDLTDCCQILFINEFVKSKKVGAFKEFLFVFDNLDRINIETLASGFTEKFKNIYHRINSICAHLMVGGSSVDFNRSAGVVFVLRDANYAIVDQHFKRRIHVGHIRFDLLKSIDIVIEKRLKYAGAVCAKIKPRNHKLLTQISQDGYVRKYFLPLFNFDYRKFVGTIFKLIEADDWDDTPFNLQKFCKLHEEGHRHGARGIIYFGFIMMLWEDDFLQQFAVIDRDTSLKRYGLCNPNRVILTLLMNLNKFSLHYDGKQESYEFKCESIAVTHLIEQGKIIYKNDTIINVILKYFEESGSGWSNVLTIHSPVHRIPAAAIADDDISIIRLLSNYRDQYIKNNRNENSIDKKVKDGIKSLKVNLNPAGFIYLNNLIVHYEFYSKLCNHVRPLLNDVEFDYTKYRYSFEKNIKEVLKLVREHIELMNRFYQSRYKPKGIVSENFLKSNFSYKTHKSDIDLSDQRNDSPHKSEFHSTRLVTHHISYIDAFRTYLLNDPDFIENNKTKVRTAEAGKKYTLQYINQILIGCIENYLDLLQSSPDSTVRNRIYDPLMSQIKKIRESQFNDFKTEVRKHPVHYLERRRSL